MKKLIVTSICLIFIMSCSDETKDVNFITVTNEELGMVDQKVYIRDLVEMTSKDLPVTMDSRTVWVGFQKGPELKSVIYQFLLTSRDIQSLSETDIEKMKTNQTEIDGQMTETLKLLRQQMEMGEMSVQLMK